MDRTRASEVGRLDKVYFGRAPAERAAAPPAAGTLAERRLVCSPFMEILGRRGAVLRLEVSYLEGRRYLPVVQLRRAA